MHEWQSQSHVKWDCKYPVVIVPKYRKKLMFGQLRNQVGPILKELCRQKGVEVIEGHVMPDHVHMCLSIPPKYSVAFVIGFLKETPFQFFDCVKSLRLELSPNLGDERGQAAAA